MTAHLTFDKQRAIDLVLEAIGLGISPRKVLISVMGLSPDKASRVMRYLRYNGHLGVLGHHPALAVLHRNVLDRERRWMACEKCLLPWPCPEAFPNPFEQNGSHTSNDSEVHA